MGKDSKGNVLPGKPLGDERTTMRLPGYEFLSVLGSGGMGTVYLARQKSLDRYVAIKVIKGEIVRNEASNDKLWEEAHTMAMLSHPNVLGCYDIITTSEGLFLVMEYIPGKLTTSELVTQHGTLDEQTLVKILLQVIDGLSYIYQKGIMHRDMKPDNIMIYHNDSDSPARTAEELFKEAGTRAIICDFGIAQSVNDIVDLKEVFGSPMYMAPEQFCAPELLDFRADIYAVAGVAYYLLTGELPFSQEDKEELIDYKLSHPIPDPKPLAPHISSEMRRIIKKMGRVHPDDRYQSYQELNDDLERLLTIDSVWFSSSRKKMSSRSMWKGIGLGVAFVVALHGLWLFQQYIWEPYFNTVQISLAQSLGYWKRQDNTSWTVISSDPDELDPILRGRNNPSKIILYQPFMEGYSVNFMMRHFGEGSVTFGFLNDAEQPVMMVNASRETEHLTIFKLSAEKRNKVYIGELIRDKQLDWIHITMSIQKNRVVISANGNMMGVAHFTKTPSNLRFFVKGTKTKLLELKDIYRNYDG